MRKHEHKSIRMLTNRFIYNWHRLLFSSFLFFHIISDCCIKCNGHHRMCYYIVKRSTGSIIEEKQLRWSMQYERLFLHFNYCKEKYCCSEIRSLSSTKNFLPSFEWRNKFMRVSKTVSAVILFWQAHQLLWTLLFF